MGAELQKPYHGSWRGGIKNHSVLVISLSSLSSEATKEVDKRGVESEATMKDKLKMKVEFVKILCNGLAPWQRRIQRWGLSQSLKVTRNRR